MVNSLISTIQVAEQSGPEQGITRAATAITAFVGRTLRGPVNRPVMVSSFNEYQAIFGGLWQPSSLSYAVEQFFDNGGRTAVIVRVINGGRPPTLTLAAGAERLVLRASQPGTREFLRASIDYDGIADNDEDRFNLVLQRVRAPHSEHIEDQEIFRRLSTRPEDSNFLVYALAESQLARVLGQVPAVRPDRTWRHDNAGAVGYVYSNPDGDDGAPLTDYDVIGSASRGTGIFALGPADPFNLLCIPPLTRDIDVGPSTLLVAAKFCRERHALLVIDPRQDWKSAAAAIAGLRLWELHSENALMYFPRILAHDRLRGRFEQFACSGAVAGIIARNDEQFPVWLAGHLEESALRPGYRTACEVSGPEAARLAQFGVNTLRSVRAGERVVVSQPLAVRTLAARSGSTTDWQYLAARRLALFVVSNIERDTRWVVFETNGPALRRKVAGQIASFMQELEREGAFGESRPSRSWFVTCDERLNGSEETGRGNVNILFGFAAQRSGDLHAYLLTHGRAGSRVRQVILNRLESGDSDCPLKTDSRTSSW